MSNPVEVYIEIEKHSNYKYEYNKETNALELDRILPYPYFYPYAYGYIPNTLAMDGDDLDILIISDRDNIKKDAFYKAFIIGVLIMEDEKGMDEKVLCVLDEDREKIKDISDINDVIKHDIHWFFSNYKNRAPGKWSRVHGYKDKTYALDLYKISMLS
jgi:inorganic pyrophosphatase